MSLRSHCQLHDVPCDTSSSYLCCVCRIKREEEARVALEEAKKLAEEMAHKQAELERRLNFNRGLQVESNGLAHTQDVTRAFVFSYFELLQWLGIDISEIELLKMTKF